MGSITISGGGTDYDILYDTAFQTGSVTLKKSIANYKYIEVVYGNNVFRFRNNYGSSVFSQTIGSWGSDYTNASNKGMIWSAILFSMSGTTFTINNHSRMYFYQDYTKPIMDNTVYGYVTEIRGYN